MPTTPISNATLTHWGDGPVYRTRVTIPTGTTLTVADQAGNSVGAGGLQVLDMPEGVISFLGASTDITYTIAAFTGDADMVSALGTATAGTDNGALSTTEANIIASTATALDGTGTFAGASTAAAFRDGSAPAVDVYLNGGSGSTDWASDRAIDVAGTIDIVWCYCGDN
ncbi:MAG: hypothetical protein P1V36_06595 [Planctomycetota bacterium]|nr:hypothetical protein [Planctomycetota bacterium]